nr:ABC transporter G family member 11-like [Tanacetum cinerariifolium]
MPFVEPIAFGVDGSSWLKSARILVGQHVILLAAMAGFRYRFRTRTPEPSYEWVYQWKTSWRSLMDTCNSSGGDSEVREMRLVNAPFVDDRMPFYRQRDKFNFFVGDPDLLHFSGEKKKQQVQYQAYVTQDDTLITTLTVRESVYYSAQLQLPNSMPKADKKERAEATIIEMGLQDSMDTRIGGWGAKGLSGGQKRRVSICIEILTRPKFLFLDEPTSGLDSAASYYVMSRIARLDQHEERTIIASIHQPCSEDIEQGSTENKPTEEIINMLIASYRSSTAHHEVNSIVAEMCKKGYGALDKKESHASISAQSFVLMKRSFINMHRDLGYYWLRLAIYLALSLVFERERLNGHYTTEAFVIANTLSSAPYLLLVSIIPGALAYYMTGLREGFDHFAYYTSVLFSSMLLVESLMMIVASIVSNYLMGIIMGAGIQGLMVLGGGFFRLPNDLPHPFWKYPMFYVGFHKYAYQGLFKNEFEGINYIYNEMGVQKTVDGGYILRKQWQVEMGYSKWIDLVIILGMVVVARVLFWVIMISVEKVMSGLRGLMFAVPKKQMRVMVNPLATPAR